MKGTYFSGTVLKKDITRFAPVWGLYTCLMLLFIFLMHGEREHAARFASNASYIMQSMGLLNIAYGGIVGLLLFGDLYQSRLCNALHAMPMRREGWFFTHLCAGMLFCLVPNLLGALVAAFMLGEYAFLSFLWLALMILQYLFFFGVAVFSCMCAGNRLGAAAVYAIVNFFAALAVGLYLLFYEPMLYGVKLDGEAGVQFSPIINFASKEYVDIRYDNMTETAHIRGYDLAAWRYLLIAAAVGVAFLALALLIYRKRKLESAGDLIAFRPVAPVFLGIFTIGAGALLYLVARDISTATGLVFLLVGLVIGYFSGRMLLERRVNVFHKKSFLGLGILLGVFVLTMAITWLDPVGITRYVPQAQQVQYVRVSPHRWYYSEIDVFLKEEEQIGEIARYHWELTRERPQSGDGTVWLEYHLKDGRTVTREYEIDPDSEFGELLKRHYSTPKVVFGAEDLMLLLRRAETVEFYSYQQDSYPYVLLVTDDSNTKVTPEDIREKYGPGAQVISEVAYDGLENQSVAAGLIRAMQADCENGTMAQHWQYHQNEADVGFVVLTYPSGEQRSINIFEGCENTIAFLKTLK